MSAPPTGRPGSRRRIWVGLAVGAAFAVAAIEIVALVFASGAGTVIVSDAYFQYTTPPTVFCPYTETTGGPPLTFDVRAGSVFNMSWGFGCEPYGPGNTSGATFAITSVVSSTFGFKVVDSNVPVVFGYGRIGTFNVSVRAPDWATDESLELTVQGGPYSNG
jgi:hypothetical protein